MVIPGMPPGTLGFRVSGRLTRDDHVNVLVPPRREALAAGQRLRVPYAIGPELHLEPGAVCKDLKVEVDLRTKRRDAGSGSRSAPASTGSVAPLSGSPAGGVAKAGGARPLSSRALGAALPDYGVDD